jgi:hypothetical protein
VITADARSVWVPFGSPGVHAFVVRRVHVGRQLLERRDVHERHEDQRAGEIGRLDGVDQLLHRNDRRVLGPVRPRHDREHRTWLGAVQDRNRNVVAGV